MCFISCDTVRCDGGGDGDGDYTGGGDYDGNGDYGGAGAGGVLLLS